MSLILGRKSAYGAYAKFECGSDSPYLKKGMCFLDTFLHKSAIKLLYELFAIKKQLMNMLYISMLIDIIGEVVILFYF